jgi:hypothetical protein
MIGKEKAMARVMAADVTMGCSVSGSRYGVADSSTP